MKKFLVAFIISVAVILPCFALGGCGAKDAYTGKQFKLTEVTTEYDDSVSETTKTEFEARIQAVKDKISSTDAPFCRFYSLNSEGTFKILITNCNGAYRLSKYTVEKGQVAIDTSTSVTNDKLKLEFQSLKLFVDDSLENAVFSSDGDNLILSESNAGVSVKYVFAADGVTSNSASDYIGNKYEFFDVSYWHYTTDEAKDREQVELVTSYLKDYRYGWIEFTNSSEFELSYSTRLNTYDYKQDSQKNEHLIDMKISGNTEWNYHTKIYIHGDLLLIAQTGSGTPIYIYFYKVSK